MRKSGGCRKIHLVVMSILLMATGIAIAQPSTAAVIVPSGIIFDGSPGVNAPPSSLGPYAMAGFGTDPQPLGTDVAGVDDASTGADIGFSPSLVHLRVAQGWATWSNDYTGDLYATYPATSTTISLRQARTDSISMLSRIFSRPSPSLRRHRTAHPPGPYLYKEMPALAILASIRTGRSR